MFSEPILRTVKMVPHFLLPIVSPLTLTMYITLTILINGTIISIQGESIEPETLFEAAFQGECHSNGPCQHLCFDLHDGTFECACHPGYILSDNGYSCLEIGTHREIHHQKKKRIVSLTSPSSSNRSDPFRSRFSLKEQPSRGNGKSSFQGNGDKVTQINGKFRNSDAIYYSCGSIECEAGGSCEKDENFNDHRVRCRCPLGRGGFFCEKPMEIRFPRFHGRSYLALPTLRDAYKTMRVNIEFRPEHREGILLYSGENQDLQGDFVAVVLVDQFVEFRFDCGIGEGVIRSKTFVVLNAWNNLTIYRDGWSAWLQLNEDEMVAGQSQGLFSRITFNLELFLGGSPNISLIADRVNSRLGFVGCVRKLGINGHSYDFRSDSRGDAIDGVDTGECNSDVCNNTSCLNGGRCVAKTPENGICMCPLGFSGDNCEKKSDFSIPSFNGSSYLQFAGLKETCLSFFEISLIFKPRVPNGVILFNGNRLDAQGDFISVNLVNGYVEFRFDLGSGPAIIRSPEDVELNRWHKLYITRTGQLGLLQIDNQETVSGFSQGGYTQLSLSLNLFLGGVSDFKDVSPNSAITHAFSGCIQKVTINGRSLMFLNEVLSGVNVIDCPNQPQHCSDRHDCSSKTTIMQRKASSSSPSSPLIQSFNFKPQNPVTSSFKSRSPWPSTSLSSSPKSAINSLFTFSSNPFTMTPANTHSKSRQSVNTVINGTHLRLPINPFGD